MINSPHPFISQLFHGTLAFQICGHKNEGKEDRKEERKLNRKEKRTTWLPIST
jgi:hypothetical protein